MCNLVNEFHCYTWFVFAEGYLAKTTTLTVLVFYVCNMFWSVTWHWYLQLICHSLALKIYFIIITWISYFFTRKICYHYLSVKHFFSMNKKDLIDLEGNWQTFWNTYATVTPLLPHCFFLYHCTHRRRGGTTQLINLFLHNQHQLHSFISRLAVRATTLETLWNVSLDNCRVVNNIEIYSAAIFYCEDIIRTYVIIIEYEFYQNFVRNRK